jgi:hypothetical protein
MGTLARAFVGEGGHDDAEPTDSSDRRAAAQPEPRPESENNPTVCLFVCLFRERRDRFCALPSIRRKFPEHGNGHRS